MKIIVLLVSDDFFFNRVLCQLVLINETLKGERYLHVLALFVIVHKGNIQKSILHLLPVFTVSDLFLQSLTCL